MVRCNILFLNNETAKKIDRLNSNPVHAVYLDGIKIATFFLYKNLDIIFEKRIFEFTKG